MDFFKEVFDKTQQEEKTDITQHKYADFSQMFYYISGYNQKSISIDVVNISAQTCYSCLYFEKEKKLPQCKQLNTVAAYVHALQLIQSQFFCLIT